EEKQALRIAGLYARVLAEICADPSCRHDAAPLLAPAELHRLQVEWNDSREAVDPRGIRELFAEQVLLRPGALAVRCGGEALTYAELDAKSTEWAHALARRGIGAESVVALLLDRGIDFLAAMLAVFKAGAAYVPLDPLHPPARQAQTLAQSGAALILASESSEPSRAALG